jgi:hypothetical protein
VSTDPEMTHLKEKGLAAYVEYQSVSLPDGWAPPA